ncbi:carboxynorspermidine decarboxylase [Aurantimonas sp. NFXS3]|uniref:carboxynorspermidine decarboxylase n=1 Tax=Aurantimonas sp. NFXS3 TaxID=2818434 RepID=UPI003B8C1D5B
MNTPYYLIDKARLLQNLERIAYVRKYSGSKALLALKCFATWSVFEFMRPYMDGTTSSSLNEVKLGRTRFGGETHAYSVAWADHEIEEALGHADKVIFNSISQLNRFRDRTGGIDCGLRINPGVSSSTFDLADPVRPFSRLGEGDIGRIEAVLDRINGFMIHNNCENEDFDQFSRMLDEIEDRFGEHLGYVDWVSLGGGIHFTANGYPRDALCDRLRAFSERFSVQVYLEPGEATVTGSTTLEVSVVDTLFNGRHLAVVDASIEAHMLDLLIYREEADVLPNTGPHEYMICGKSCLAGDVFGTFRFEAPLKTGDRISIQDAAGYTMVKKNWFNGLAMPSIAVREIDGSTKTIREFGYTDYETSLS